MKKELITYLLCLFFFKVAVGAILLVTGWDSLGLTGNGLVNITAIMALSFFPAAFARPLFQKLNNISIPKLVTYCLGISGMLIMLEHYLMGINTGAMFTTHFILWIFIFIIEVACEKWYVTLSHGIDMNKIRRLSGISTSIAQLGIIIGPLTVMLAKQFDQSLPYWMILVSFIIGSGFSLSAILNLPNHSTFSKKFSVSTNTLSAKGKNLYILGFSLIWPTLTIFNLSIPVLAKTQYDSINIAGILEMLIALATAVAGFAHPYVTQSSGFRIRTLMVFGTLLFAAMISYLYNGNIIIISLGIFFLGLTFGYLRVELRAQLSRRFSPVIAGEIVAAANSLSGFLIIIYSTIFYLSTQMQQGSGLTLSFPVSFIFCSALFIYILNIEANEEVPHAG